MQNLIGYPDEVEQTIVAMERAALERWGKGDPSGFLEICAEDVSYFDPFQARRLDGIEALRALYESIRGKVSVRRFELLHPRVQRGGDMAVLTFHYVAEGSDEVMSRWNCTEVYARRCGSGGSSRRTGRLLSRSSSAAAGHTYGCSGRAAGALQRYLPAAGTAARR